MKKGENFTRWYDLRKFIDQGFNTHEVDEDLRYEYILIRLSLK